MRKIIALLIVVLTALSFSSYGQSRSGKVNGTVIDGSTKIIESATITLHRVKDSSVAKMSVADKTGKFVFEGIADGKYFVSISAVGHQKGYSEAFEITPTHSNVVLKTIELIPQATSLGGVSVSAKKPLIEQKPGKTVINVDASPTNAGLNVLELLEKSPGVSVDNDGNISIKGKQGVLILIDGKQTYMSGADLANLLKNMPSSNLEQLEIMTNPPAKYDASGNSGIINIKTKKNVVRGMNGSVSLGYTQGIYGRTNNGINLNYRNSKVNIFGGYNGGTWEGYNRLTIGRNFYNSSGIFSGSSDQVSRPHFEGVYHSIKLGTDYYFSKKDIIGFVVNGSFNNGNENPESSTNLRDAAGNIDTKLKSRNDNRRVFSGLTSNINYKHTFDSTGREISADLDYASYNNKNQTELITQSFYANGTKKAEDVTLQGRIPSMIDIYTGKIDYIHPFKNGLKLEAGVKASYVKTNNQVNYMRRDGASDWMADTNRSNHFVYSENINAAYAIFSKT
ncbi:MAG TPA: TonB-dependent receptor, partial [Chitinophagaceae bacterium]|nr:TonB-dependent receptor [Chitinophagaceae bacterium]